MHLALRVRWEFKLADMWVGVYWETDDPTWRGAATVRRHIWICVVPCCPLHISFDVRWN